jgi:hypothetical protein
MATTVRRDPAEFRAQFDTVQALHLEDVLVPDLRRRLVANAAAAAFVDDDVEEIGTREVEAPQRVGGMLSVLLGRPVLYDWLGAATGLAPIRAVSGRLVQTRANDRDELAWHNDLGEDGRVLAVVINLSDLAYEGGRFDLRREGVDPLLFSQSRQIAGAMTVFAVRPGLEHRVTPLTAGGPRRVYAGWFLARPEPGFAEWARV